MRFLLQYLRALLKGGTVSVTSVTGLPFLIDARTSRLFPPLAGADDGPPAPGPADPPPAEPPTPPADPPPAPPATPPAEPPAPPAPAPAPPTPAPPAPEPPVVVPSDFDPERAMRTISQQRESEKRLKETNGQLSDQLRAANLTIALQVSGIQPRQALATAKLLEGVEYDAHGQPTNLDDAIAAAVEKYGETAVKGVAAPPQDPPPAPAPPGAPPAPEPPKPTPPSHGGGGDRRPGAAPQLTAEELQAAEEAGMTPQRYEVMRGVKTLADYQRAQEQLKVK